MALISLTCPACGAVLNGIDNDRDFYFCNFCGNKITFDKTIIEHRGSVNIQGIANEKSLLQRASIFLGDSNFEDAAVYYDRVLDINPTCAAAYIGKLCCENHCSTPEGLQKLASVDFTKDKNYQHALEYSTGDEHAHYEWINGPEHLLNRELYLIDNNYKAKLAKLEEEYSQNRKPINSLIDKERKVVASHSSLLQQYQYDYNKAQLRFGPKAKAFLVLLIISGSLTAVLFILSLIPSVFSGISTDSQNLLTGLSCMAIHLLAVTGAFVFLFIKNKQETDSRAKKIKPIEGFVKNHETNLNSLILRINNLNREQKRAEDELRKQTLIEKQATIDLYKTKYPSHSFSNSINN